MPLEKKGLDVLRLIFKVYIELGIMQEGDEVIVPSQYLYCLYFSHYRQ